MISDKVVSFYPQLLNFTYEVINSLKGKKEIDDRQFICEQLATKIFLHATTIQQLRNGSNLTLKDQPDGSHVIDFASVLVITRAILETYLNVFEVFFEPRSDDEFEYRYAVYQIEGLKIAEIDIRNNPLATGHDADFVLKAEKRFKEIENFKNRVKATKHFKGLDTQQQKSSLEGRLFPKRNLDAIAKEAGFGEKTFQKIYAYLSAYTHGDSLSIAQITGAISDNEKDSYMRLSMALAMIVLSHLAINYARRFPEAKAVFDAQPANAELALILAKQASSMK